MKRNRAPFRRSTRGAITDLQDITRKKTIR